VDIDLNGDLGEGSPHDAALLALVSSANIACGYHAGDAETAERTIRLALEQGVTLGAHPGHADRAHFGRRELERTPAQVYLDTTYQVGALAALARIHDAKLHFLKPHGALYHQAGRDLHWAASLVRVCVEWELALVGPPGTMLEQAAVGQCPFLGEGFADRRYGADGSLIPRTELDALIDLPDEAVAQVFSLVATGRYATICIHGDHPAALAFATQVRAALLDAGHRIRSSFDSRTANGPAANPDL